ncbi:kinase-like domain-containing protein [Zychaea mexicana]|uniref:kinase-like domain-containing protein n=1 Tax=Zychaea mexicana TaxID=64656 RepID=UPI0022FF274C|nr:kinase-like domain-containing protein [Zychaea mexicana]KAI9490838.1 kinase-like domain-containing protein [Zychaea mexicana]
MSNIKLGQYTIIKTIGTGSFGKVKLAVHGITGQKVALKFINKKKIASMDLGGRVKREIQYLKLLRHPHIIKLYEVISTPTDIIMVIEYAGGELFNYIVEKGRMAEDDARRFFQQIICAVEYCHRHKIVHRDLKPENLLLDANNNVKIADFGLSNIMTDGDFLKTSCGSPNYAAPEVISGRLYAGPEVDVWSCGVILYVMLCGRLPFDDEYIPTLFKKINGGIYTMPSFLSPETKYLLTSMLVVDPMKRITIQEIRQNPWFNANLPAYLCPLPHTEEELCHPIDDRIAQELAEKMGYPDEKIHQALEAPGNNQFKVAYQLVIDHKRMLKDSAEHSNIQSFFATSPPPWNTTFNQDDLDRRNTDGAEDAASSISVLSSSLPKYEESMSTRPRSSSRASMMAGGQPIAPIVGTPPPGAMAPVSPAPRDFGSGRRPSQHRLSAQQQQNMLPGSSNRRSHKPRSKWHFGIRSRCPVWEVMLEIYRSLQNVGIEWRVIDLYHTRCRYRYESVGLVVKFDLQLYKLGNNSFLVDFKNVATTSLNGDKQQKSSPSQEQPIQQSRNSSNSSNDNISNMSPISAEHGDPFGVLQGELAQNLDKLQLNENEQADLSSWQNNVNVAKINEEVAQAASRESILSVYPFLDICSKVITDIV